MFIPLVPIHNIDSGPTNFVMTSHHWEKMDTRPKQPENEIWFSGPPCGVVFMDYRTIHRGLQRNEQGDRDVLMLILARDWFFYLSKLQLFIFLLLYGLGLLML